MKSSRDTDSNAFNHVIISFNFRVSFCYIKRALFLSGKWHGTIGRYY